MNSELEQKSTEELIKLALTEKDEHIASQYITILHFRGTLEVLEQAQKLCQSKNIKERCTGIDILGQLGIPQRTFPDEFMQLLEQSELPKPEEKITLYGVTWEQYDTLVSMFMDRFPGLRMTFLEGTLEIINTSSIEHEILKKNIARLLEMYAVEKRIPLNGYGNTTFCKKAKQRGLEPDECYCLGELREVPDIAIEIIITSGGIDKLSVYQGLGVREIWLWQDNQFSLYRLIKEKYEKIDRSEFLPDLDLTLLSQFVNYNNQTEAVIAYRDAL
ncbi:MAG: Uma2 family endonuclease [Xenococcaceae cyanobacterium]